MTSVGSNIRLLKDVGNSRYASEDSRTKRSVHELIPFGSFVVKICFRSSWTYMYCLWLLGYFFTQKFLNNYSICGYSLKIIDFFRNSLMRKGVKETRNLDPQRTLMSHYWTKEMGWLQELVNRVF
jgi:hypothetical protein